MKGTFEDMVAGTLLFIQNSSERELAEFIVNQQKAVDGLSKNNEAYVKTFKKMHAQQADEGMLVEQCSGCLWSSEQPNAKFCLYCGRALK